jgi:hypothetical protein
MSREDAPNLEVVMIKVCETCYHYIKRECWCNRYSFQLPVLVDIHYRCDVWESKIYGVSK